MFLLYREVTLFKKITKNLIVKILWFAHAYNSESVNKFPFGAVWNFYFNAIYMLLIFFLLLIRVILNWKYNKTGTFFCQYNLQKLYSPSSKLTKIRKSVQDTLCSIYLLITLNLRLLQSLLISTCVYYFGLRTFKQTASPPSHTIHKRYIYTYIKVYI